MLVKQANDVCVETVETSNLFNEFLSSRHRPMICKILDFVKYFRKCSEMADSSFYICLLTIWDSLFKAFKQTEPLFKSQF